MQNNTFKFYHMKENLSHLLGKHEIKPALTGLLQCNHNNINTQ